MSSLAARATRTAVVALCLTLAVVGVVTAGVLHWRAGVGLDRSLLAAAYAEAHPWQDQRYRNDHVQSPVAVRPWRAGDPRVSEDLYRQTMAGEVPVWQNIDGQRVLLLVVETREVAGERGDDSHPHLVIIAEASAVSPFDAALPFLGIYLLVAGAAVLAAGLAIRVGMQRALAPLSVATLQMARVQGLGSEARLTRGGPVEVDQLLASTNALLDRLESAFGAQSSFTAQAAHELRTPVTVLKGELDLALRRPRDSEAYRQTLVRVQVEVDRLADLVEGLMMLTRVESGQAEQGRERERLSAAVHRAVQREGAVVKDAGGTLHVDLTGDRELRMQVALVTMAVGNLIRNAAVHAAGQPCRVSLVGEGDTVEVVVEDGGSGIAPEDRERVLERFQRAAGRRQGLGLGLPLAREIARRHGGDLKLEESQMGGLKCRLILGIG